MGARRLFCAICLFAAVSGLPGAAGAEDKLVLQLDGKAQFEFAGYLAAVWQGYYREAGLDVEVASGTRAAPAPTDPVREVTEGRAQFGTGDVGLLVRAAQGLPLLVLAPVFQESGIEVYYRADGDYASPGALAGARVGRLPASSGGDIELRSALASEGVAIDKLRSVAIEPGQNLEKLQKREIDAAIGSAWELPWRAKEKGVALRSFNPAQYRVAFYGDSLFTLQRFAAAHPDVVRRFRAASLKGWEYALQHPDQIIERLLRLPPPVAVADAAGFAHYQAEIARKLAHYPAVPLGTSNPERWRQIQNALVAAAAMAHTADLDAVIYDPQAEARHRTDAHAYTLLEIAAVLALAVAGLLAWRWRWRPAAAGLRRGRGLPGAAVLAGELRAIADAVATPVEQLAAAARQQPHLQRAREAASGGIERLRAIAMRLALVAAPEKLRPRPSDLNRLLDELSEAVRRNLPGGVAMRYSLLPEAWPCEADPEAVAAAVLDLVGAAGRSLAEGGEVIVGTRHFAVDAAMAAEIPGAAVGDYVRLTVKDNGPGLPQDRLERVDDPERTADPAISAAAQLARDLGGFARVETAEGVGTAVHLYFRRSAEQAEAEPETREDEKKAAE